MSLSLRTIDNLIAASELATCRVGRRVLIARTELERFVQRDHPTADA